jgi:hypothetical protein
VKEQYKSRQATPRRGAPSPQEWDVFISYAWEDKAVAAPLAEALQDAGLSVWYDEFSLKVGDNLRRAIESGLSCSKRGVVIVSPAFLRKAWPQRELDTLIARESHEEQIILPVWHGITAEEVTKHSPLLATRVATMTSRGLDVVIRDLLRALGLTPRPAHVVNRKLRRARIQYEASRYLAIKLESSGSLLFDYALGDWELREDPSLSGLTVQEESELKEILDVLRLALMTAMPLALAQAAVTGVLAEAVRAVAPEHVESLGLDALGVEKLCRDIYEHDLEILKRSRSDPSAVLVWDLIATLISSYVGAAVRNPQCLPDELPTAARHHIATLTRRASARLASVQGATVRPRLLSLLQQWRVAGKPALFTTILEALLDTQPTRSAP